ncbi:RdgB/HAM1 family non-canonical purine NTP pyrophosphatase [Lacrimispora saccharolytica]|uniref:RdgB/HAM1 family non-canonical purine NTP pyrophosphatase n=1 Tax=Lacrimispora saccharolytica TaxID=84030 RepID=UPI001B50FBC9|nr:RdgB/HAM1 family non-canonical purine NTP pyrophosphatase [Lacrimispora saccharolytica]MBP9001951.1 RdgB/HAM1 family non-canonical purine NTP pyrophosphatase [Lachnospiraceae bacterium]MCF2656803.1 RdgB/HAM1 family non-canonical purine NTP pyrophosphatase [Lacrimispora saccharolytica]MCI7557762.1 RdgB/HAM1 family non-canonical purine NTP pyrophosphatase [Lachnospiraceae bacterium]
MRLIFATGNKGKMNEIREIMSDSVPVLSMAEAGVSTDVEEDGNSFMENSFIKARAVARTCKEKGIDDAIVLADDSGLVVDALNGEPGIYSARYLGEDTPYSIKNAKIIERLNGVSDEDRTARFVCAIACVMPDGREYSAEATYEGAIGYEERGEHGFGYDPIFYLPDRGVYSAELDPDEKNRISHRGKALRMMKEILSEIL